VTVRLKCEFLRFSKKSKKLKFGLFGFLDPKNLGFYSPFLQLWPQLAMRDDILNFEIFVNFTKFLENFTAIFP